MSTVKFGKSPTQRVCPFSEIALLSESAPPHGESTPWRIQPLIVYTFQGVNPEAIPLL